MVGGGSWWRGGLPRVRLRAEEEWLMMMRMKKMSNQGRRRRMEMIGLAICERIWLIVS